jgi:hypothetical protein
VTPALSKQSSGPHIADRYFKAGSGTSYVWLDYGYTGDVDFIMGHLVPALDVEAGMKILYSETPYLMIVRSVQCTEVEVLLLLRLLVWQMSINGEPQPGWHRRFWTPADCFMFLPDATHQGQICMGTGHLTLRPAFLIWISSPGYRI